MSIDGKTYCTECGKLSRDCECAHDPPPRQVEKPEVPGRCPFCGERYLTDSIPPRYGCTSHVGAAFPQTEHCRARAELWPQVKAWKMAAQLMRNALIKLAEAAKFGDQENAVADLAREDSKDATMAASIAYDHANSLRP